MSNKELMRIFDYKNGFFPIIPTPTKGVAILLQSSKSNRIIEMKSWVTPREISAGKYDKQIEITLSDRVYNISLKSMSIEKIYWFNVDIKVKIRIINPLEYYESNVNNLSEYLSDHLEKRIKNQTKFIPILEYDKVDDDIYDELSKNDCTLDFIQYKILNVKCSPCEKALGYIEDIQTHEIKVLSEKNKNQIVAEIEKDKNKLAGEIANANIPSIIFSQVVEGKISQEEAIIKIKKLEKEKMNDTIDSIKARIKFVRDLNEEGVITDKQTDDMLKTVFNNSDILSISANSAKVLEDNRLKKEDVIDAEFKEKENADDSKSKKKADMKNDKGSNPDDT